MKLKVAVASTGENKLDAVRGAFAELGLEVEVEGVLGTSDVPEQPIDAVTLEGAANRMDYIVKQRPEADFHVAIENGIFREGHEFIDRSIVMLRGPEGTDTWQSQGVRVPRQFVVASALTRFTIPASHFMAAMGLMALEEDFHYVTELVEEPGRTKPRAQIMQETLAAALWHQEGRTRENR
jgi:hypothetical protein